MEEALELIDDGIGADRVEERVLETPFKYLVKATILEERGNLPQAISEMHAALRYRYGKDTLVVGQSLLYLGQLLARSDSVDQAGRVAQMFRETKGITEYGSYGYWLITGEMARSTGDFARALEAFETSSSILNDYQSDYLVALGHLEAGNFDRAISEFEKLSNRFTYRRALFGVSSIKMKYYLAIAYEGVHKLGEAENRYEEFLLAWGDTEPEIQAVTDAKERLSELKRRRSQP